MSSGGSSSSSTGIARPTSRIAQPTTSTAARRGPPSSTISKVPSAAVGTAASSRVPMGNATNRNGSAGAAAGTAGGARGATALRKPTTVGGGAAAASTARRLPSSSAGITGRTQGVKRQAVDEEPVSNLADIQAQLAAMADMFDQERRNTTAQMAAQESERKKDNDRILHLEETLEEQKRLAGEQKREVGRRRTLFEDEMLQLRASHAREKRMWEEDMDRERQTIRALKDSMAQNSTAHLTLESTNTALRTELQSLQDQLKARDLRIVELETEMVSHRAAVKEIEGELREAESLRRKLHNEVQELRGNIRVFARIRPALPNQADQALATIRFPNAREAREMELLSSGESATGTATMKTHGFSFDRVFGPDATQVDVFDEVQHLMQSVLDGYNTCIFAYGQTGSGKTHTLEGPGLPGANFDNVDGAPEAPTGAGLIPRAVQMLFNVAEALKDKGWTYHFEGGMLEIYNETINDLLGKGKVDEVKHEIKHDAKTGRTTVSDAVILPLTSPAQVFALLSKAASKRSVAATLMNERSSRSHSVFSLRVRGSNPTTLESCDATLHLVDLAGSERLANSGSGDDPRRLKEAVSINKSLSSLADVIAALGSAAPGSSTNHIPYRNSTLTWLLKNSLGGNSKSLMMVNLSPMAAHLNESLCSLRFAAKVNSTFIGTARKVQA